MSTATVRTGVDTPSSAGDGLLELTGAQLGIWNAQRLEPDSPYYVVGDVLHVRGDDPVDVAALVEAVRATAQEAETLRLRVVSTPDGPRQYVDPAPVPAPAVVDLRGEPDPHAAARELVDAERARIAAGCRDMTDRPLFHPSVAVLADTEVHYLQLGHHLVFDGYSATQLCRRVGARYTAAVRGEQPPPCPFRPFADLVAADLEYRAGEQPGIDRAFWRDLLTPLPEAPPVTPAPEGPATATVSAHRELGAPVVARLKEIADGAGVTWGELVIAGYAAFLHRLESRTDVVFALPLMCRAGSAALRTPAMMVNVLPLRLRVRPGDRLDELGLRTAAALRDIRSHQRFRGEDLPRELPGAGALLHGRGINLKASFDFGVRLGDATGVLENVAGGPPEDLGLTATPTAEGGLLLGFETDARTNDEPTVARRLDMLADLLTGLAAPELPAVGAVRLLPGAERDRVLAALDRPAPAGVPSDLPELLDDLGAYPDRTALVHAGACCTAGELVGRVRELSAALRGRGLGPGDVVAVSLPREPALVVALLAVLDAGAAFLVLDPAHPAQRRRELLDDARPALLLGTPASVADLPGPAGAGPGVPVLDPTGPLPAGPAASGPLDPDRIAYLLYTSGSTGRPKGVLVRASGFAALVHHHRGTLVAEAEQLAGRALRIAHTYSFAFDAALDQLLWLLAGHELHLYDTDLVRDGDALAAAVRTDRIDVVDTTPSLAGPLLDAGLLDAPDHRPVLLILGGEATPEPLWRRVAASGTAAYNLYGPTETTVDATLGPITGEHPTIGLPLAGTRGYLLDAALQPVATGEPGELYVAGPHLALGYLDRPGTTAERFVANPFGPGRMYRTGDRARLTGAGLEFLGRDDGQVKIRGYRVELGEVEAALAAVPGAGAAAVTVRAEGGRDRLVGYVTGDLDPDAVRDALAARVPGHLVPSTVLVLDAFPTTVNGKLDRAALPAPAPSDAVRAPATDAERALHDVVAGVLGADRIDVDDDFLALGGDSITAISVGSRLRETGLELRPRDLLARRSLAALAATALPAADREPDGPADDPTGPVPAPPIVRGLLDPNPDPATVAGHAQWTALRIDVPVDVGDLTRAVGALLTRHDALRLRREPSSGGSGLTVLGPEAVDTGRAVRETVTGPLTEERVADLATLLAGELDPAAADLVRVLLARTGDGSPDRLLVVVHHLAVDGVSWRVLLPDLHRAWEAASRGLDPAPGRTGASWRRHATVLAEQGGTGARRAELPYWLAAGAASARLGERALDPRRDTAGTGWREVTELTREQTTALVERLPAGYRAGVDEVLLAALALALRSVLGPRDAVTVSTEGHGRSSADLDLAETVGWFTVEHPVLLPLAEVAGPDALRDALAGGPAAGRLLRAVKEAARAVPGDGAGHGVLRHLDPAAPLGAEAPPDVLVNYLGRFAAAPGAGWRMPAGPAFGVTEPPGKALEQLLALNCFLNGTGDGERLSVEWTVAGAALGPERVAEVRRAFGAAVAGLAAHAGGLGAGDGGLTPSDLPLVRLDQAAIDELARERPVTDVLPATALQAGLAFHSMALAEGDADVYVVQAVVTLAGALDPERMRAAAAELLRRHPSLRIHLAALDDGQVVQVVPTESDLDWRFADLTGADDPAAAFAGTAAVEQARPFDPARPPLIRFLLARLGPDEHRLAITNHHALLDGWSMPLVGRALLAIHDELSGGPAVPAPPPVADHFAWLAARDHDAGRRAWRELLDGVAEGTRIAPGAGTGAAGTVARPERHSVELGAGFSAALRRFARERGVTLTAVLHTAWGIVLGRVTGRRDVVFGQPVSGRPAEVPGVEKMVGQLGNTVPVRVRWTPEESALAVLERVHDRAVALSEHHHVGLPEVQRDAGVGDLFDTMLVMENFPAAQRRPAAGTGPGPELTGVEIADATHYPLTVVVIPDDAIVIGLGYQPAVLGAGAVRALGHALHTVLGELVADPGRPALSLPLLDPGARAAALRAADGGPGATFTLAERFAGWVASRPDHPAVQCRDRVLSYAELDRRADELARELVRRGVRPEQPVAVLLDRDVEMPLAIIGILRAGAVYLPLDPSYPQARLATMVADAAPVAALTVGATTGGDAERLLAGHGVPRIRLDEPIGPAGTGTDAAGPVPLPSYDPDRLAYIIFTSGTTGRPKPVGVAHAGLADLVLLAEGLIGATPDDRVLQFASTSFDVAFFQTTIALASGGTSVVAPAEVRESGDALLDHITEQRVTLANLLPSFLSAMPDDRTLAPEIALMVGAERLDPALARRWGARRRMVNCYGPTEVSINAVTWGYDPADPGPLPIGVPDPGIRAYVLDTGLQPVGPDRTGELYLAGAGVARGYLGRPGATASAFVANPYGAPGERMYRTGDLVHLRADGQIAFLGRVDHQVKIRGFRIEPGEIETVPAGRDGVRAAAVIVREDRLVGYVVPADGAPADTGALRTALAAELPAHMVPAHLVLLDRLPLTPAGKLDRDALPAPDRATTGPAREPATDAERALLEVLRAALGDPGLGPDDDFLAAGGDSIVSLQVLSRARRAGWLLTARDVFDGGTVAGMAARAVPADPGTAPDTAGPVSGDAPLTPVMRDLLRRGGPGRPGDPSAGYCQWVETVVPAGADEPRWHRVLDAVLATHDVLRAHLADGDGEPVLRVPPPGSVTGADVLVRTALDPGADPRAVADRRIAAARDGLDPYRGPLLRAEWLDAGADRPGRMVLLAHHLVVDPVSWRVLLDDLAQAYRAAADGARPALPPSARTWVGWAGTARAATDARRAELGHWRAVTAHPDTGWGERASDPARDTAATARHHEIRLDPATTEAVLTALPQAHGTGPDAVLLTALARAAHRWRGRDGSPELLVDLQGHGRPTAAPDGTGAALDLSRTVGWFTTVVPALVRPGDRGPAAVGEQIRAGGDGLGYGLLRDAPDRPLGDVVRPRVTLNYLGRFTGSGSSGAGAGEPWRAPADAGPLGSGEPGAMPFPHELAVNALATGDGPGNAPVLAVRFTWPDALFTASRIEALAEAVRAELVALAGTPGTGTG